MPKKPNKRMNGFGKRLAELRTAAGYTQVDLAHDVGTSGRMISYYERQTKHPPTNLLPKIAKALCVTTDELLGVKSMRRKTKARNLSLQRRIDQIEKLPPAEKRQVIQLLDTFIERRRLKSKLSKES